MEDHITSVKLRTSPLETQNKAKTNSGQTEVATTSVHKLDSFYRVFGSIMNGMAIEKTPNNLFLRNLYFGIQSSPFINLFANGSIN